MRAWRLSVLCGVVLSLLAVPSAYALVVTVDLGWGYNAGWTSGNAEANLTSTYNLQEGSIVQVIMYDSSTYPSTTYQAENPIHNFDTMGNYLGPDLSSAPYTSGHVPGSTTTFNPLTTPNGHVIAATYEIGSAISDPGGYWYNIYEQFEVLGTYDTLYVRVFGTDDIEQQGVWASYWGLSSTATNTGSLDTWFVPPIDNTTAAQSNYFEVIPEPGTMALLGLGGIGLLAGYRRRRKASLGN